MYIKLKTLTIDINPTIILPSRKGNQVQNEYISGIIQLRIYYAHD